MADAIKDEDPSAELDRTKLMCQSVTEDSIQRTRSMLALCEESEIAGIKTLVMLNEQGEQLNNVEAKLFDMKKDISTAERNLKHMGECCDCSIFCCFSREDAEKLPILSQISLEKKPIVRQPPQFRIDHLSSSHGPVMSANDDEEEDEIEQNIMDVSSMVTNLRHMAIDMGTEIESQNVQLDRISETAEENTAHIEEANKLTAKLIEKE